MACRCCRRTQVRYLHLFKAVYKVADHVLSVFAYSYNVAALDFVLPNLQYLYWHDNVGSEFLLEALSSVGLIYGSIFFGYLADRFGRRFAGSSTLVLIIFSNLGFSQSSSGLDQSMSMLGWLCFWRILLCIGAGALLPINSVVLAE
jgi:PHS family inorganic phosphate transporter-like MFS transporter